MGALCRMSRFIPPASCRRLINQPTQVDYSDLYSIMSFFCGPPDRPDLSRDDLAQRISENGRQFGEAFWRWEDMQSYMLRLLLE